MPIPNPNRGESRMQYIQRCMADTAVQTEYPSNSNRFAVCEAQWGKFAKRVFATGSDSTYTIEQEIFSVGEWHDIDFTVNDLKTMAASFHALKDKLGVPLKLGHNEEQPFAEDGLPAFGWVSDMRVDTSSKPEKLVAKFEGIPQILYDAMKSKLYRNVSIELDFGVKYKSEFYDLVVSAVAILGADAPAVHTLNDLAHYLPRDKSPDNRSGGMSRQPVRLRCSRRVAFTFNFGGEGVMPKEQEGDLKVLMERLDKVEADLKATKDENEDLKNKLADAEKFKKEVEDREKEAKKEQVKTKRSEIKGLFESAVKANHMTPAQRENFEKVLHLDDDESVEKIKVQEVETLIGFSKEDAAGADSSGKPGMFSSSARRNGDDDDVVAEGETVDGKVVGLVNKVLDEKGWDNTPANFSRATSIVFRQYPKLAREYTDANGSLQDA